MSIKRSFKEVGEELKETFSDLKQEVKKQTKARIEKARVKDEELGRKQYVAHQVRKERR